MTHPPQDADREANRSFSKFAVMCIMAGALTAIALAITKYAPAQDTGDMTMKLVIAGAIGWFASFLTGVYTARTGGSGDLGLAMVFLILHAGAIIAGVVFASSTGTSEGVAAVHQTLQWTLMGLEACYLLLVTWN